MIYFWENHLNGTTYASWYPTVFSPTTSITVSYQPYGVLQVFQEPITQWANYYESFQLGTFKGIVAATGAVAAVSPIIRERSIGRFVFSRVFGRVN